MILVLDNRDSFVFNLARYIELLGVETAVQPSHAIDVAGIARMGPQGIVISPGPCTPAEAGCSIAAVQALRGRVPILGVCLGHQAIAAALGARIVRAREPVHGRTSPVHHDAVNLFAGIESPMAAARYHSLVVDPATLPAGLTVTARDDSGTVMAIEHASDKLYGVQFHPESILTPDGFRLIANFLDLAGIPHRAEIPTLASQLLPGRIESDDATDRIVTF
ncbi:MAG: aminodeoxychorismate/anthranilate synthase component II [Planctomycetia bacterium]|nr:aminodeoxychorismate/anthranilate synthase component II [Planctomycetia bacterium]